LKKRKPRIVVIEPSAQSELESVIKTIVFIAKHQDIE